MTEPNDPGGVWCRKCGSIQFSTVRTYPCIEGTLRVHECGICGTRFGSLATYIDPGTIAGDASGRFTRIREFPLPVQPRP